MFEAAFSSQRQAGGGGGGWGPVRLELSVASDALAAARKAHDAGVGVLAARGLADDEGRAPGLVLAYAEP